MRDRIFIFAGLVLFVGLFAYPFWHALAARGDAAAPQLEMPASAKQCVLAGDVMRTSHMQLLLGWRDSVVRHGQRDFAPVDGQTYRISLDKTCVGPCHTARASFCDRCHVYAAVANPVPYCWDCHQGAVVAKGGR